jgi:hypothetical protein
MKKILTNSLFFMGFTYLLCNAQDASIKNTPFPFDTNVIINCQTGIQDTVKISRYSKIIYSECPNYPSIIPVTHYCDFLLQKKPEDSLIDLVQINVDDWGSVDTVYHNTGIQYLVPLDSITLYMQVTSIKKDTFSLRFDTASFLPTTSIKPETGINPAIRAIRAEKTVRYYDLNGRVVPSKNILKNKSIVSNRMIISGNRLYIRFDH